jgi:iron complex transport system ATP-binding protein
MDTLLSVEKAGYRYGDTWALRTVSLEAAGGELLGVLGPNGSGKSTLLRVMDGLADPHEGAVRLNGRPLRDLSRFELARSIAMVSQENHFQFSFLVMEVVLMGRFPHMKPLQFEGEKDRAAALKALEATGTLHLANRDIHTLSGGEKQRVLMARALAQEPSMLLLDEPTAFLDLKHKREIFRLASSLAGDAGMGVVVVSHDMDLASQYCDRLLILKEGRVVAGGRPEDVLTPSMIEEVFDCPVLVDTNPGSGRPRVTVVP